MFTNKQIELKDLPKLEDMQMTGVHPKYLYILIFNILITYCIGIISLVLAILFSSNDSFKVVAFYGIVGLVIFTLATIGIYILGFKMRVYAIREKDICYAHGYFVNKTLVVPYNRIQHIEITRSFLARKLGLSSLKIFSAGESGGDLVIPGLPKEVADSLYAFLTRIINERV
jgi:membrane protein YdbS with pleckstrin-like domain